MPTGTKITPPATCHPDQPNCANGLCKSCYQSGWAREHAKEIGWRIRYKLTRADVVAMLARQNELCPVCLQPLSIDELVIDHDHRCCSTRKSCGKCVRGVVHRVCNSGVLGVLENKRQELQNAEIYLSSWNSKHGYV